jgi:putative aldouronate transport system substrate-binding protein
MRKTTFTVLALIVLAFALVLSSCAAPTPTAQVTATPTPKPPPTEIKFIIYDIPGKGVNAQPVVDKLNELSEEAVNVTVTFTYLGSADYATKLTTSFPAGADGYDLCSIVPGGPGSFSTLSANGQLLNITDLLDEYGADVKELVKDYVGAYTIAGKTYGLPTYRNIASLTSIIMRKDILDELGLTEKAKAMTSFTELEEIFTAVKAQGKVNPIGGNRNIIYNAGMLLDADKFADHETFDPVGDNQNILYADQATGKVSLLPENAKYKTMLARVKGWNDKGWIYPDAVTTTDHPDVQMKTGLAFATIQATEFGAASAKKGATGYDVIVVDFGKNIVTSGHALKFGTGVPINASEPEAAISWLNWLYTTKEAMNLLTWGIEGTDYVVANGEAGYPEGLDSKTVKYHQMEFVWGNQFLLLPWKGAGADFREKSLEVLKASPISNFMGFTPNLATVKNEIAALQAVNDQYRPQIYCGKYDDALYAEYVAALNTAGAQTIIDLVQTQLDTWKAAK